MATLTNRIRRTTGLMGGGMRLRGRNNGLSATVKSFLIGSTLVLTLAQFFALSHEVAFRHFRCAEHGELTHIATSGVEFPLLVPRAMGAFMRSELETVGAHEHCISAFTVDGGSSLPIVRSGLRVVPQPPDRMMPLLPPSCGRASILASAPKTSPPPV